eukprot:snap_masked-scaffold_9-processed-gene-6.43-mRNA-1 protein AED:1.00 eAED:1.00 QI:0/0/0/0/1/1/2/0/70
MKKESSSTDLRAMKILMDLRNKNMKSKKKRIGNQEFYQVGSGVPQRRDRQTAIILTHLRARKTQKPFCRD